MYYSYADILESYIIEPAEESKLDGIKNAYNTIKNSKGGKAIVTAAKGIGAAYTIYSTVKGIGGIVKNNISSAKGEEIERFIKNKLLIKYRLIGKLKIISDYSPDNSIICALSSQSNISEDDNENLHLLLSELKQNYKFLKYRIGSDEEHEVLVKIFY